MGLNTDYADKTLIEELPAMKKKQAIADIAEALVGGHPVALLPALGIDIDGCIDEAPLFFRTLADAWPGKVIILTYRDDREKAIAVVNKFHIRWDELILVNSFAEKAKVIAEKGIMAYFDDQPEMLQAIPPTVNVFLIRNEGNFDFEDKRWTLSRRTGKLV